MGIVLMQGVKVSYCKRHTYCSHFSLARQVLCRTNFALIWASGQPFSIRSREHGIQALELNHVHCVSKKSKHCATPQLFPAVLTCRFSIAVRGWGSMKLYMHERCTAQAFRTRFGTISRRLKSETNEAKTHDYVLSLTSRTDAGRSQFWA